MKEDERVPFAYSQFSVRRMGKCLRRYSYLFFAFPTALLFLTAILISTFFPDYIEQRVAQEITFLNGSSFFDIWFYPSVPVFLSVFIFDVVNPDEIMQGKTPIQLREVGPFVFQKFTQIEILEYAESDMSEMKFKQTQYYLLRRDKTNMQAMNRNITMLNFPLVAFLSHVRKQGYWGWFTTAKWYMKKYKEHLFIRKTPYDFLLTPHKIGFPGASFSFSVMGRMNNTDKGEWMIHTGVRDRKLIGSVITYNNKTNSDCWSGPSCNEIRGGDGVIFPSPIRRDSLLTIFSPDLKTPVIAKYKKDVMYEDMLMYQFNLLEENMLSPDRYPPNDCYCIRKNISAYPNYCPSDGILDVSDCTDNTPDLVISQPHFLNAHTVFLKKFVGLNPEAEKHESYLHVDPALGITVGAETRVQVNLDLDVMRVFEKYENVTSVIFPSYYTSESVHASGRSLDPIRRYYNAKWLALFVPKALLCIGVVTLAITIAMFTYGSFSSRKKKDRRDPAATSSSSSSTSLLGDSKSTDSTATVKPKTKKTTRKPKLVTVTVSDSKTLPNSNDSFRSRDSEPAAQSR